MQTKWLQLNFNASKHPTKKTKPISFQVEMKYYDGLLTQFMFYVFFHFFLECSCFVTLPALIKTYLKWNQAKWKRLHASYDKSTTKYIESLRKCRYAHEIRAVVIIFSPSISQNVLIEAVVFLKKRVLFSPVNIDFFSNLLQFVILVFFVSSSCFAHSTVLICWVFGNLAGIFVAANFYVLVLSIRQMIISLQRVFFFWLKQ